jgi:hypothetical protein
MSWSFLRSDSCLVYNTGIVDHHSLKLSSENDTVDTIGFILFSKGITT